MLKDAEPLEGSTCTDADCTLVLTPALLAGDVVSAVVTVLALTAGAADFAVVLLAEVVEELAVLVEVDAEFVVPSGIASPK
jgi:hypothetical protein